ncbi:Sulfite reduction-associated complex DsrMKJOP protein DsrM (= HmeC) [hydrothermal vent metagenome]|uniref:Sulfite reduction-associated complex DsrMKJOP protein DsrM (= HmeC) n=1 Tax=hydrothermal vent metagenome TaxID=652676 RepID=A0A3B1C5R0_9ZZZZ
MKGLSSLSLLIVFLCYTSAAIFLAGFVRKVYEYAVIPAPLKIPTMPAPTTKGGVVLRMTGEILLFTSLFKGNKWTWIGGYIFHIAFMVIVLRHLRYVIVPTPDVIYSIGPFGIWAGIILVVSAGYLFARRVFVGRTRYISSGADYFALILMALIAATGLAMQFLFMADISAVKEFMVGLVTFSPVNVPRDHLFVLHLLLVMLLLVYFPFSKMMHAGGVFFSPTRTMPDDSNEKRHINPWSR